MMIKIHGTRKHSIYINHNLWIISIPYIICAIIFTPQMEKVKSKIADKNPVILGIISVAGMLGVFSNLALDRVIPFSLSGEVIATIAGFSISVLVMVYAKKSGKAWPRKYGLTIAMIGGMLIGCLFL